MSWAQPCTAPATTTAGYDLPHMPVTRPRQEYAATAATDNPTASATLFRPADLEALTYGPPVPSYVLAPTTTGAHHGYTMPLALTTALTNAPALAAPRSVQPRQLNRPSHVIHITWPETPHYGPHKFTPVTSAYAHATPIVVKYARPKLLLYNDYLTDRSFTWVASDKSDDSHRYVVYLWARGYTTALHLAEFLADFAAGHPAVQEHYIAVGPPAHVLSTGVNLLTVAAAEHDVIIVPPEHPHAESTHPTTTFHPAAPGAGQSLLWSPSQYRWPHPLSSQQISVSVPAHRPLACGMWVCTTSL